MPATRVLIVDDHIEMARLLADQLADAGYATEVADGGQEALERAQRSLPDLAIVDLRMEGVDGFDVLEGLHRMDPAIPVLIMTAFGAIDSAIDAIKRGAYHYLTKPFQLDEVLLYAHRALEQRRLQEENRSLRRIAIDRSGLDALVGRSAAMQALYDLVERAAPASAPVLIRGESGSGKELVARALHFAGPRRSCPFVAVNCTALPASLLESELFGHVRGAFTGATAPRRGLFLEADGGTLLLDEIGDMPAELQAKLLRVLEDGVVRAVGADATRKVDVRVVASTHHALEERVRQGLFREDLFYRLNVVPITVPTLRERPEDIPLLAEHFLNRARERNPGSRCQRLSPELVAGLARQRWPGNVRELENLVERLVILCTSEVAGPDDLPPEAALDLSAPSPLVRAKNQDQLMTLRELQDEYIGWVVQQCGGNKTRAAEILGIDVSTIHRRDRGTRQ